jgi:DNA-binding NarL/FixJ family response regulator
MVSVIRETRSVPRRGGAATTIRVGLADSNTMIRNGLRMLLSAESDMEVVGEAGGGEEAIELVHTRTPDVLILNLDLQGFDGLDVLERVWRRTRTLVVTNTSEPWAVIRAIEAGARGFLTQSSVETAELLTAVRVVAAGGGTLSSDAVVAVLGRVRSHQNCSEDHGGMTLTARERQVMDLVTRGMTNREIAAYLVVAEKTVRNHLYRIYRQLHVNDRHAATVLWRRSHRTDYVDDAI